ncbi:hypothetical protein GCM10009868_16290 [Terrabacter aerolatus]|uniref:Lipoprotein n=1 Tax=Terrabacter aerolatus TaxID=422442 RepID=A0A512D3M7_9MICO|nr:hypothetical protein [Terrabacter aerolatus]GEO31069.1 hypothetical protein TAE01_28790 [Terrabacter aerolatus]
MKAWSAHPAKRAAVVGVVALGAVSLLGGCGFETRQQAAAVVNGTVIHESDVRETFDQLKAAKLDFAENIVVTALVAAPLLKDAVSASGSWKPDETYASVISSIPGATDTTKEFVEAVALIQSQKMTPADVAAYRADLKKANISVNPKYGSIVQSDQGPVYFTLGQQTPNWVKPGANPAPAATPTPAQ